MNEIGIRMFLMSRLQMFKSMNNDKKLLIIDDVFPHPASGFRYQEFNSILEALPNTLIYSTGESLHWLGKESLETLQEDYIKEFDDRKTNFIGLDEIRTKKAKISAVYTVFLHNAYNHGIDIAEQINVPFIFCLYPGGMFSLNDEKSDHMLARIIASPNFQKVIVTQKVSYDYLVEKFSCDPTKIELIFGVVTPLTKIGLSLSDKVYFGKTKKHLDVCFVAHKYTPTGEDKGYDVFVDVAKKLSIMHDDIYFHVVGPYDESVIDLTGVENIKFYGSQKQDWFDTFYKDKDILLSPNINGKITKGSFDGFPTGCATDASLRGVMMMVTDPLGLNTGYFQDGNDIAVVEHDPDRITDRIDYYYNNPKKLEEVCRAGYKKVNILYDYEHQVKPRIKVLEKTIMLAKVDHKSKINKFIRSIKQRSTVRHSDK